MSSNKEDSKVIIALDYSNKKDTLNLVSKLDKSLCNLKVGYELFLSEGQSLIKELHKREFKIFLDLKLHDIPNTCVSAIKAIRDLKINYLTIHISSGLKALSSAKKISGKIKLIGVTILTSLDNKSLKEIGFNKDVKKLVLHQAKLAAKAKLDAIVCSPLEVSIVKKVFKKEIITPGIRFNLKNDDQKRILTPKQAYKNGSDWLVIGRPITKGNIKKNIKKLIDHLNQ